MKDIVIVGAGGLGREVLSTIEACNAAHKEWNVLGFLDANLGLTGSQIHGVPVLGDDQWCERNPHSTALFFCAIGDPHVRRHAVENLLARNCNFATIVHPETRVPSSVRIGPGSVVMAGSHFTTDANIGPHTIIYLNCAITHDVQIGSFCTIASGCNLSGGTVLEAGVQLGTGVSIIPRRKIGAGAIIGAGSVVIDNILPNCTAAGVPCRVIKS